MKVSFFYRLFYTQGRAPADFQQKAVATPPQRSGGKNRQQAASLLKTGAGFVIAGNGHRVRHPEERNEEAMTNRLSTYRGDEAVRRDRGFKEVKASPIHPIPCRTLRYKSFQNAHFGCPSGRKAAESVRETDLAVMKSRFRRRGIFY